MPVLQKLQLFVIIADELNVVSTKKHQFARHIQLAF
jgi:hypothetical protein